MTRGVFNGNLAPKGQGGALYLQSPDRQATVRDSAFNGNLAGTPPNTSRRGGAILNFGNLNIEHVTMLNNGVVGDGGAIANDRKAQLNISNATLGANAATGKGAGLFNLNTQQGSNIRPLTRAINVTFSKNAALGEGGNIYAQDPNSSYPDVVLLNNTIVEGSDGPALGGNCGGTGVKSLGHNLDSGTSCGLNQAGDISSADAKLDAPMFNGGPIPTLLTMKPQPGSQAIDSGDNAVCAAAPVNNEDETGGSRPKGAACDMGAFEAEAPKPIFSSTPLPPGPLDLGSAQVGTPGQVKSYVLQNVGTAPLNLTNGQKGGANANEFNVATGFPLTIAPNGSSTFDVSCAPNGAAGPRNASYSFSTNDPDRPTVNFDLKCSATAVPTAGFSSVPATPGPIGFGPVEVGSSKTFKLKIQESGNATLTVNTPVLAGPNAADFGYGAGIDLTLADGQPAIDVDLTCTPGAPAGGPGVALVVKGAGFLPGSKVLWNGVARSTLYINGTTLQIQVAASDLAQPGDAAVSVSNPSPGGGVSNAVAFVVAAPGTKPPPAISGITPSSVNAVESAGNPITLVIKGSNFVEGARAQWDGVDRPTDCVSATELRMAVNGADTLTTGQFSIRVLNPDDQESNVLSFTVGAPGDNPVAALSGYTITGGSNRTIMLSLSGSGFIAGSKVLWNGIERSAVVVNDGQITLAIASSEFQRKAVINVLNPAPGGGQSNDLLFAPWVLPLPLVRR